MNIANFIFLGIICPTIFNKVIKYASCGPDDSTNHRNKTDLVDLDLGDINSDHFEITKSEDGPEGYKITPKNGKKLDLINMSMDVIWLKSPDSECESVTIYNTTTNELLIVLNIVENGLKHCLHLARTHKLGQIGMVEFLDLNNEDFKDLDLNRKQMLDISDNFDKLYFDYTFKEQGDDIYESYDVYDDDIIVKVNEGRSYTIWDNDIGATKVEVYKKKKENSIMKIKIDPQNALFLKYRGSHIRWDYIEEKEFDNIVGQQALKKFDNLDMNPRFYVEEGKVAKRIDLDNENFIDISKQSIFCKYDLANITDNPYVKIAPINPTKVINKILEGDTIIHEGELTNPSITYVRTNNNVYYLEVTYFNEIFRAPNLYFKKTSTTPWAKLNQLDFYESFVKDVKSSEFPTYLRYLDIDGSDGETVIPNLPQNLTEKIQAMLVPEDPPADDPVVGNGDVGDDGSLEKYPELDYIPTHRDQASPKPTEDPLGNIRDKENKDDKQKDKNKKSKTGADGTSPDKPDDLLDPEGNSLRSTDEIDEAEQKLKDKKIKESGFVVNKLTLTISIILLLSINNFV